MRPYLAIIKDSFREALASRVLWILLILITCGLLAIAPLGFRSEKTTKFRPEDFANARAAVRDMLRQYDAGLPSPGYRIVGMLSESAREKMMGFAEEEPRRGFSYYGNLRQIIEHLNGLLKQGDLYREEDWTDVLLGSEVRELLDRGVDELQEDDVDL